MIVNRDYIFSSYEDITISYIFPQIRTFYLKNCTVGQPLKFWKNGIFEVDLFWVSIHSGGFIFTFFESSKSEIQNATNQTSLSFLVQKL